MSTTDPTRMATKAELLSIADRDTTDWQPHLYRCTLCDDIIFSARPGAFCSCKCGESFVDETRYYTRLGGSAAPWVEEDLATDLGPPAIDTDPATPGII